MRADRPLAARALALTLALALVIAPPAAAQRFAEPGDAAAGYAQARPDRPLRFPRDHGPHPAFRIEWWYLTANLRDAEGRRYGAQYTLFRQAAAPPPERAGWENRQIWLGHAALTTADRHFYAEKIARGGVGQAGATAAPFEAWIDDWRLGAETPETAGLSALNLSAAGDGFGYDLRLTAEAPPTPQGAGGYSLKSLRGQASHYYSQPHFEVAGRLEIDGAAVEVTGRAWMDREWSSDWLQADQPGWDWVAVHFEDGAKLMAFRLRHADGAHYTSGNWIAGGVSTPLGPGAVRLTPLEPGPEADGRAAPTRWRIEAPSRGVDVETAPLNPAAWNGGVFPYWEGPISVAGSHAGEGYLEMTGY
ncbi:MAG: lipocalin-like domain-containing protein [Pseudomonadota bacterium]